jgi:hypothetical protein
VSVRSRESAQVGSHSRYPQGHPHSHRPETADSARCQVRLGHEPDGWNGWPARLQDTTMARNRFLESTSLDRRPARLVGEKPSAQSPEAGWERVDRDDGLQTMLVLQTTLVSKPNTNPIEVVAGKPSAVSVRAITQDAPKPEPPAPPRRYLIHVKRHSDIDGVRDLVDGLHHAPSS